MYDQDKLYSDGERRAARLGIAILLVLALLWFTRTVRHHPAPKLPETPLIPTSDDDYEPNNDCLSPRQEAWKARREARQQNAAP